MLNRIYLSYCLSVWLSMYLHTYMHEIGLEHQQVKIVVHFGGLISINRVKLLELEKKSSVFTDCVLSYH